MGVRITPVLMLCAAATLAACSTLPRMSDAERLALYTSHAGPPVDDVRYTSPIGWERVDDQHVVINMRPRESYLLTVDGPCLDWGSAAPTLSVETRTPMRLTTGFDRIHVAESPVSCRIQQIRLVDMVAVRQAREAMAAGH